MKYSISPLYSQDAIQAKVKELAKTINNDYKDSEKVICICLLKGSYIFFADIVRELTLKNLQIDFLRVSSYGSGMESSQEIIIKKDIELDIKGADVILFDDIIDTGLTLEKIFRLLAEKKPNSIAGCVLLNKPSRRIVHQDVRYLGFEIPNTFVVGYGIDYNENHRELPYIGQVLIEEK